MARSRLHCEIMREFRGAFRRLRQQPWFALAAIGTLALGIASPTALFAVVDATLLRPLPYPRYQDIYFVRTTMTDGRFTIGLVASEELSSLRRATDGVAAAALTQRLDGTILSDAPPRQVTSYGVSEQFFDLFGLSLAMSFSSAPAARSWWASLRPPSTSPAEPISGSRNIATTASGTRSTHTCG
jgi:putative ABC transport system permease protein